MERTPCHSSLVRFCHWRYHDELVDFGLGDSLWVRIYWIPLLDKERRRETGTTLNSDSSLGKLGRMVAVSRFCRTLATLLVSGVPIVSALLIVKTWSETSLWDAVASGRQYSRGSVQPCRCVVPAVSTRCT